MRRPVSIPSTEKLPQDVRAVVDPMRENLQALLGQLPVQRRLARLGPTATTADLINAWNSLVDLLYGPQGGV